MLNENEGTDQTNTETVPPIVSAETESKQEDVSTDEKKVSDVFYGETGSGSEESSDQAGEAAGEEKVDTGEPGGDADKKSEDPEKTEEGDSKDDSKDDSKEESSEKEVDFAKELKIPEDSTYLDDKDVERIALLAKEQGLSLAGAQKVLEIQEEKVGAYRQALHDQVEENFHKSRELVMADPELGGDNFENTNAYCVRALKTFGGDKLIQKIEEARLGNDIDFVRFMAKAGKHLMDDELIVTNQQVKKTRDPARTLYPNHK